MKMIDEKLIKMVKHAYSTVPFYKKLIKDTNLVVSNLDRADFGKLPLIDKAMVSSSGLEMLSEKYNGYMDRKDLLIRRTSGSTGCYLKIYWNKYDDIRSMMGLWYRRKQIYGISTSDKYCYFYTTNYISNKFVEEQKYTVLIGEHSLGFSKQNLNSDRINMIYLKMVEFNPDWIIMQPSVALLFTTTIKKYNLPKLKNLKYIELTGEYLTALVRSEIQSVFQCNVVNQYGCMETNSIASDCRYGNLHIQSSNVFVEILQDGKEVSLGEEGELYITSLENYAMPFVRYKIGEKGMIHESKICKCGNKHPILQLMTGRECVSVITETLDRIPPYVFIRPIEYINEKVGNIIRQFQVIQKGINQFTVKLVLNSSYLNWKDTIKELFIKELKESLLENAQWEFEYTDMLFPCDKSGKLSYFINEYKD